MKYDLHPALREEIETGSVWLSRPDFLPRTVVKIRNTETGSTVFCEAKMVDKFFCKHYQELFETPLANPENAIFVNAWYRKHLGIESTNGVVELDIVKADSIYGQVRACLHHPQVVVRIAMVLGLWSFVLSVIGIALAVIPLLPEKDASKVPAPSPSAGVVH